MTAPALTPASPPHLASPATSRLRVGLFYAVLLPMLATVAILAIAIGSTYLPWQTIVQVIASKIAPSGWVTTEGLSKADQVIVWLIRVPRVAVAAIVGAGLAVAGAIMQGLFRNPLAEAGISGVGAGAVLGAVAVFASGWASNLMVALPLASIAAALLALTIVYTIATSGGVTQVMTFLLAGSALGQLFLAFYSLILSVSLVNWQIAQEIIFWTMGGLDSRSWTHVWLSGPFVALGIAVVLFQSRELDLLMQGEETAASLGVNVEAAKRTLMFSSALLAGASVAVAGSVGFVGLIVPHAVRLMVGPSHRVLIPASAVAGSAFLILCDLVARTVHPPTEVRLGVVTALCGAPFFLYLLLRRLKAETH